jgi:hypothetical protein
MVWRGKGRRKAARALKEAKAGSEDDLPDTPDVEANADSSESKPSKPKPLTSAETKTESSKSRSKGKSKARARTPLPKGRPSKKRDDGRRDRSRAPRPASSPAPFIIAGAFVLGAILIVVIVSSKRGERRSARSDSRASSGDAHAYSSGNPAPAVRSSGTTHAPAPPRPRGGAASPEIRFVLRGLTRTDDGRYMTAGCGRCGTRFTSRVETCPGASCGARIRWPEDKKKCRFCCPHDKLKVDDLDQIPKDDRDGFCAYCGGSGKDPDYKAESSYIAFGITRDGTGSGTNPGACIICKGSNKCARCVGSGWIEIPDTFGD